MNDLAEHRSLLQSAIEQIEQLQARIDAQRAPIAVVGIGTRLPGAETPDAFWAQTLAGVVRCGPPPQTRGDIAGCYDPDPSAPGRAYVRDAAYLDDIEQFDAAFFRLLPAPAAALDPQHRMLLEASWNAIEDAGIDPLTLRGSRTGVYVGLSFDAYGDRVRGVPSAIDQASALGGARSLAAGRISYFLDLHGPSLQLDTACSSSALAVHQAVQALRIGDCDLALAGGANALIGAATMIELSKLKALSPSGRCHSFDARADGYGRGEGAVLFALRRLADAEAAGDRIHAVIHGSASNHDGASNGLTAPNGVAQEAVIRAALEDAGVLEDAIGFIEAHGTGTPLGDPIEAAALARVFAGAAPGSIALGSGKAGFGHLEAAAGALGLLRAILAVRHGTVPPQPGTVTPTHRIDWAGSPLRLATTPQPYSPARPLAGVSSFGMSGTNVHLVVGPPPAAPAPPRVRTGVARLSAASPAALRARARQIADHLAGQPAQDLADIERSLAARAGLRHRAAFAFPDLPSLIGALHAFAAGDEGAALAADAPLPRGEAVGRPISLPAYPFERERHWIDLPKAARSDGPAMPPAPLPAATGSPARAAAGEGDTSALLRAIVGTALGIAPERIDPKTPFVEIGADSLMLLDAVRQIEQRFGIVVEMGALFEGLSTIAALAAHIDAGRGDAPAAPAPAPVAHASAPLAPVPAPRPAEQDAAEQSRYFSDLVDRFVARHRGSKAVADASRGALADSRRVVGFRPSIKEALFPIVGVRAEGPWLWDVDGNRFVDLAMGFGVSLFGHGFAPVEAAISAARDRRLVVGPQSPDAGAVAEALCRLTGFDRAAFCNSGTEAVMTALRLARAATGRSRIVTFSGSYHGHFDGVLGAAGAERAVPVTAGVTPGFVADLTVLDYGAEATLATIAAQAESLAAILVEPVQSRRPDLQPAAFLQRLRALADRHGIALIFDEVLTGLRVHPAGAQGIFGVKPDLATYGKILGGGLPIGAVAGAARFLDGIDGGCWNYGDASAPMADRIFFGGTFNKNALSMAAARAVLETLADAGGALQDELNRRTDAMVGRIEAGIATAGHPVAVARFGSLFRFVFPRNADAFYLELACRGVYVWEGRNCFLSTAHDDAAIDHVVESVLDSLAAMRAGGMLDAGTPPPLWQAEAPALLPAPSSLAARVRAAPLPDVGTVHGERTRALDAAATAYAAAALAEPGAPAPRSRAQADLLARWRDVGEGALAADIPRLLDTATRLGGGAEAALLRAAGEALGPVLRGERHPLDALAPQGDFTLLKDIYVRPALAAATNELLGRTVAALVEAQPPGSTLDILEIGAGTGSATGKVLAALGTRSARYLATDMSLAFFDATRWPHRHDSRLRYATYDMDRDAVAQGMAASGYDLIVASNALHVAADLPFTLAQIHRLLRPGGLLLLNELTAAPRWLQLVFGLTDGWWSHRDAERLPETPLLAAQGWERVFRAAGLPLAEALEPGGLGDAPGGAVLIGQKRRSAEPSRAQRQLHALAQLDPAGAQAYTLGFAVDLQGPVDEAGLAAALTAEAASHDALTAVFAGTDAPRMVFDAAPIPACAIVDRTGTAGDAGALEAWERAFFDAPFDLARGPLFRAALLRLGDGRYRVAMALPHIVGDGVSLATLWERTVQRYAGQGLPDAPRFADHLETERAWLAGPDAARCRAFWAKAASAPEPATQAVDWRGGTVRRSIGGALVDALRVRAAAAGMTPFMLLFAAHRLLLRRTLEDASPTIGVPIAGRSRAAPGLVGYCTHLLPIAVPVPLHATLDEHLTATRAALLAAYAHQDLPFAEMPGGGGIDLTFNMDAATLPAPDGCTARQVFRDSSIEPFALRFNLTMAQDGIMVEAGYQQARFDRGTVERLLERYHVLLRAFADAPGDRRLVDLAHQTAEDVRAARGLLSARPPLAPPQSFPAAFLAAVARAPDSPAIRWRGEVLSYDTLHRRAAEIAAAVASCCPPGGIVAIDLPRGPDLVAALIGTMLAGAAYLPLDPAAPAARRAALLASARPMLRIGLNGEEGQEIPTLRLDQPLPPGSGDLGAVWGADDLAYVIATSGSTGTPKLVGIEHGALAAYLESAVAMRAPGADALVAAASPAVFDVSVLELFATLYAGGTVLLLPDVAALLAGEGPVPTTLGGVPSAMAALEPPAGVTDIVLAGEAVPQALADRLAAIPGIRLHNGYGPTETTVICLQTQLRPGEPVTIGRPLRHATAYLLDPALRPVGIGETGELYIAGPSLARGYLGQPGTTARAFVPDPFGAPGTRMYRTGDLAQLTPAGTLRYLGRRDGQVKLNGIRVELGEIETALARAIGCPLADVAAVTAHAPDGRVRLVGFARQPVALDNVRAGLATLLPAPLQPATMLCVEAFPRTASGKLDRKQLAVLAAEALLPMRETGGGASTTTAMTEAEARIAAALAAALGVETVGLDEDFYALGGDSIVSLQASAAARRAGFILDPKAPLLHRTVRAIAREVAPEAPQPQPLAVAAAEPDLVEAERDALRALFEADATA